jgi:hypothetical protein
VVLREVEHRAIPLQTEPTCDPVQNSLVLMGTVLSKATGDTLGTISRRWGVALSPKMRQCVVLDRPHTDVIDQWIAGHCAAEVFVTSNNRKLHTSYYFQKTSDATLFRLRWEEKTIIDEEPCQSCIQDRCRLWSQECPYNSSSTKSRYH